MSEPPGSSARQENSVTVWNKLIVKCGCDISICLSVCLFFYIISFPRVWTQVPKVCSLCSCASAGEHRPPSTISLIVGRLWWSFVGLSPALCVNRALRLPVQAPWSICVYRLHAQTELHKRRAPQNAPLLIFFNPLVAPHSFAFQKFAIWFVNLHLKCS